jgi:hypothetical protein
VIIIIVFTEATVTHNLNASLPEILVQVLLMASPPSQQEDESVNFFSLKSKHLGPSLTLQLFGISLSNYFIGNRPHQAS